MRGISAVLGGLMLVAFSAGASAQAIDYEKVGMVGVQRVTGQWVRYIVLGEDSACVTVQIFKAANRWCSIALQPDSIGDLVCSR
ncbi:MAG TPA: hypothetical protein DEA38_15340 [Stenotrophomonas sp.]|nr:hypothetical protein [Stenotrophomonas sp.]